MAGNIDRQRQGAVLTGTQIPPADVANIAALGAQARLGQNQPSEQVRQFKERVVLHQMRYGEQPQHG